MMDMTTGGHGWAMGGMWFFWILFWILVIAGVVLIVNGLIQRDRGGRTNEESPLDILKKRYAKGEIDQEQFERMKRELEGGGR